MNRFQFATLLFLASSLVSAAEFPPRTKEYDRCAAKAGVVEPMVLDCLGDEYTRQDKRLNAVYRRLMSSLKEERKKQLLETQRLWAKYTEANCAFYHDPEGGTSAVMLSVECGITARIQRTNELEQFSN